MIAETQLRVLNLRDLTRESRPAGAILVGRPSRWGNPYHMRGEHERHAVCDRFERHALQRVQTEGWDWLGPLTGRDLICFCAPRRCHADLLLKLANPDDPALDRECARCRGMLFRGPRWRLEPGVLVCVNCALPAWRKEWGL